MIYFSYIRKTNTWKLELESYNEDSFTPIEMNGLDEFAKVFNFELPFEIKETYNKAIEMGFDIQVRTASNNKSHWVASLYHIETEVSITSKPEMTPCLALLDCIRRVNFMAKEFQS